MSRSFHNKSGKGPGYEYGSKRDGVNKYYPFCPGKYGGAWVKKQTHKIERRQGKKKLEKELVEACG